MTLGDLIRDYRTKNGISQRKFASLCGIAHSQISYIELGVNPRTGEPVIPTIDSVNAIAKVMGMSVSDILAKVDDFQVDIAGPDKDNLEDQFLSTLNSDDRTGLELFLGMSPEQKKLMINIMKEMKKE